MRGGSGHKTIAIIAFVLGMRLGMYSTFTGCSIHTTFIAFLSTHKFPVCKFPVCINKQLFSTVITEKYIGIHFLASAVGDNSLSDSVSHCNNSVNFCWEIGKSVAWAHSVAKLGCKLYESRIVHREWEDKGLAMR